MLLSATYLLFSLIDVISPFQLPALNGINHHSKVGDILDFSDLQIRSNKVVECHMEDFLNIIALEDLQILIEALASRTAVSPLLILSKLHRRMRHRDAIKEIQIDTIDGSSLTEASPQTVLDFPSESKIPLEASRAPYSLSPHSSNKEEDIVIVPVISRSMMKMGHILKKDSTFTFNNVKPVVEEMSNVLPGIFLPSGKHNRLKPPPGATLRISSGDSMTREIVLTVSPLMTFVEALRQAETKYQNALGLNDDFEVITFAHSSVTDCYVLNSVADIPKNEQFGWKMTVMNRDNEIIYDSLCVPNSNDLLVKPGSVISLTYVPI